MTSLLRDARDARGWTLDQAAARLLRLAANRNVGVSASKSSLRQMISDMERGRRKPGHYAPLLAELYSKTKAELGLETVTNGLSALTNTSVELVGRIDRSVAVSGETIVALQNQIDGVRVLDRQLGSPAVIDATKGLVGTVQNLMKHSFRPDTRRSLAGVLADASALNAWQALNNGEIEDAWNLHELAIAAGHESGSAPLLAHAMGEQAYALLDLNRANDAADLISWAQSIAGRSVPTLLQTWLNAAEAEAHAAKLDRSACHNALERAIASLPDHPDNTDVPYISLNEWHLSRWKGSILARLGDSGAVHELEQALNETDPSFVRATASLECDMAEALIVQNRGNEAADHLRRAHGLASTTGSVRQLRRIRNVSSKLT